MFEELDTVELTHDIKEHDLKEGNIGAIVNIYNDGKAYEVEFVAPNGRTIALLTLMPDDIRAYINKGEYISHWFNSPISLGTVSGMTITESEENMRREFDKLVNINELDIKTESKDNMKKLQFAAL